MSELVNELEVALVVARLPGLQSVEFGGVEEVLALLGVVVGHLRLDLFNETLVKVIARRFGEDAVDQSAAGSGHVLLGFDVGGRGVVAPARNARVAAREVRLFDHDDMLALLCCGHGGRQAGAARPDDDDVCGFDHLFRGDGSLGHGLREVLRIKARLLEAIDDARLDGETRERGARNDVDVSRLILHDVFGKLFGGKVRDRVGFRPVAERDALDLVVRNRNVDGYVAVAALRDGGVCA